MEPLHFGASTAPLFGIHHPASGRPRETALLICPPWGPEYMRSYRGLRLAAMRFADAGFETLRFDYSATGDSEVAGLDGRVEHWLGDIATAARELRERSGCTKLALVGVRLGALLASAAVAQNKLRCEALIGWDAPADGARFVELMQRIGQEADAEKNSRRNRGMKLPPPSPMELCGHAWPPALAKGVMDLGPVKHDKLLLVQSSDLDTAASEGAELFATGERSHWHDSRWFATPWLPSGAAQRLAEHCKGWLP